ncbi:MAG: hypothetical protein JWQ84_325 [Mucilaginibacter sp.]|nr:hypothetical protein [Mucilaginibacter sp.]
MAILIRLQIKYTKLQLLKKVIRMYLFQHKYNCIFQGAYCQRFKMKQVTMHISY